MFDNIREYFMIAVRNLKNRSLRSWLTVFGIVMGVFLIMSLLSLSEGVKNTVERQLRSLGGDLIFVLPGDESNPMVGMMFGGEKLNKADLEMIKNTPGVDKVVTASYRGINVRYQEENKSLLIEGMDFKEGMDVMKKFQGWSLSEGQWPVSGQRQIVVGSEYKKDVFKKNVSAGSEFLINGKKYEVTGMLNSLGSKQDDKSIYMDIGLYQDLVGETRGTAQMAMVKIVDGSNPNKVADAIKENLKKTRKKISGSDDLNFAVITSEKVQGIAGGVLGIIQFAVLAFASIAIVVGGIGITNTMYTAVRERTREIGIMKAVGATNGAILTIFLFEAGIIGLFGGIGGTALGLGTAWAVEVYGQVHPMFYFHASFSPWIILFGLSFSFALGCLAGALPARQAAKLRPIEALRKYE